MMPIGVYMSEVVIKVENLTKEYRIGVINHGTLAKDLQAWWAKMRGKEDPNSTITHFHTSTGQKHGSAPTTGEHSGSPLHSTTRHSSRITHHDLSSLNEKIYALKDISFSVKSGEVLGIIGANGAGKSTLLKILSRVTSPTSGCVKIKGRIGSLLEVGTGFHPELTGRENIYLNGAILGMKRWEIDKKLDEIIDFSGVEKFIDTPVKRYSSGMYVRLAFAVAAHLDPEILVVDEVLAVGDAEFQKKCLGKMGDISKKEGRTVLFVSHNMAAVRQLCGRSLLFEKGCMIYNDTTNKTIEKYFSSKKVDDFENPQERKILENNSLLIKRVKVLKDDVLSDGFFEAGEKIKIIFEMSYNEEKKFNYGMLAHIYRNDGTLIAASSSSLMNGKTYNNETEIVFVIDTFPLIPSKYYVTFAAHNHFTGEVFDTWENAICFKVSKSDVNNTGYNYGAHWNPQLLLKSEWN
jgi:lipopolysaccharide transport system ATP-binding protein